ncbi:hypothetical protein PPL_07411 [Heterostelium album PN500]|uniref:Histone deacetylase domain-containing protein n=1 Tax=Heterostelium pallidum (strain ATCC 26659 / Pp 5 / PN500) TaxID=670386 RepID=D3BFW0_HETP5|nr:hypothetical protein PPL_07411 [Heterostelium album PN500]EFA79720.1 hypothetical protein PPL_07411 [Heterostelium album PN500]|eukprot:XP_020431841.1 hypothetical protein PPL_07411 [Heterostelium album PN500]
MYFAPRPNGASATAMIAHCLSEGHIESPARLESALESITKVQPDLRDSNDIPLLSDFVNDRLASDQDILLAHSAEFLAEFKRLENGEKIAEPKHFPNCGVNPVTTTYAARAAAGSLLELLSMVGGQNDNSTTQSLLLRGLAVVRPPGHHCTREKSSGNGILNNVAIAALTASKKLNKRVLIVDLDIHLSGGTSDCIKGDDNILLVDVYGARGQEIRTMARLQGRSWQVRESFDNTVAINVSLIDSSAGDHVYLGDQVLGEVLSAVNSHQPNLILFSIGFDSCAGDDEGFEFTANGYGQFIQTVCESAATNGIPVIGVLEGGYKPQIVEKGVRQVSLAMASTITL